LANISKLAGQFACLSFRLMLGLLRARGERPRGRRAPEKGYELAPPRRMAEMGQTEKTHCEQMRAALPLKADVQRNQTHPCLARRSEPRVGVPAMGVGAAVAASVASGAAASVASSAAWGNPFPVMADPAA
jgi:hypothetical protein